MSRRFVTILLLLLITTVSAYGMLQHLKELSVTACESAWKHKKEVISVSLTSIVFLGSMFCAYKVGCKKGGQRFEDGIKRVIDQRGDRPVIFSWEDMLNKIKNNDMDPDICDKSVVSYHGDNRLQK